MKAKDFVVNAVAAPSILVFMLLPVLTTIGFVLSVPDFNMGYLLSESVQQFMHAR